MLVFLCNSIYALLQADPEGDFWLQLLRRCAVAMANKSVSTRLNTRHLRVCSCVTTLRPGSTALVRNQEIGCKDVYHTHLHTQVLDINDLPMGL